MNDTPRTDAIAKREFVPDGVWINFARELEREVTRWQAEAQRLGEEREHNANVAAEAQAEVARLLAWIYELEGDAARAGTNENTTDILGYNARERLNMGLRSLASWCLSRAQFDHNIHTTLSMLKRKVQELEKVVTRAARAGEDKK